MCSRKSVLKPSFVFVNQLDVAIVLFWDLCADCGSLCRWDLKHVVLRLLDGQMIDLLNPPSVTLDTQGKSDRQVWSPQINQHYCSIKYIVASTLILFWSLLDEHHFIFISHIQITQRCTLFSNCHSSNQAPPTTWQVIKRMSYNICMKAKYNV